MTKRTTAAVGLSVAVVLSGAVTASVRATAITPGDLLVTRAVGGSVDTTASPAPGSVAPIATPGALLGNGVAASVEIDEYKPDGTFVQAIALPNVQQTSTVSGSTYALTYSGTQNNEGTIEISGDGKYFTLIGYNQTAGITTATGGTGTNAAPSTLIQRVVGLVSMDGTVNTTTGLQDMSSTQSPRSAYTTNGTDIWVGGSSGSTVTIAGVNGGAAYSSGGVHYTTVGSTTSTPLTNGNTNQRILEAFDFGSGPQLLLSSNATGTQATGATAFRGIATIGVGLPQTESPVVNPLQLPGFENVNEPALHETADNYWFKDKNTLYIADQRDTTKTGGASGGVQKWTFTGDTNADGTPDSWVFAYNITLGTGVPNATTGVANQVGAHGLTGTVDANTGNVDLFATTFDGTGANSTQLYSIIDNGTAFTDSLIATSATNSAFRGVAFVPQLQALLGDANLDGKVDLNDLNVVLNHLGQTSSLRSDGNFDGAATIDLNDLNAVLNNLGRSLGGSSASAVAAATPEPASLGLLGLGVAGVLLRRRRV